MRVRRPGAIQEFPVQLQPMSSTTAGSSNRTAAATYTQVNCQSGNGCGCSRRSTRAATDRPATAGIWEPATPDRAGTPANATVASALAKVAGSALAEIELTLPQYRVLVFLAVRTRPATHVAALLGVSASTMTSVVDGLVARGLVTRSADPGDRRRVLLALTTEGTETMQTLIVGRDITGTAAFA